MSRLRSFELPHKALRNVIAKFSIQLGSSTVSDPAQLKALKETGNEMFTMLHEHVQIENEHILTQLEARVPGSGDHDRSDHERLELIQDALEARITNLKGDENQDDLHNLYLDFSRYHSLYLEHIYEEETVTELLLQKHFTDEELLGQRAAVMQSIAFPVLVLWMKYSVPAQREEQNVGMLAGLKANAPAAAFEQVMQAIESEMNAEAYTRLLSRLS